MKTIMTSLVGFAVLLLAGCGAGVEKPAPENVPGGSAMGYEIGTGFDGNTLKVGEGSLEGKGVYITYFATW